MELEEQLLTSLSPYLKEFGAWIASAPRQITACIYVATNPRGILRAGEILKQGTRGHPQLKGIQQLAGTSASKLQVSTLMPFSKHTSQSRSPLQITYPAWTLKKCLSPTVLMGKEMKRSGANISVLCIDSQ